jgi:hypothetical protein
MRKLKGIERWRINWQNVEVVNKFNCLGVKESRGG